MLGEAVDTKCHPLIVILCENVLTSNRPEKAQIGPRSKRKGGCTSTSCQLSIGTINEIGGAVCWERRWTQSATRDK